MTRLGAFSLVLRYPFIAKYIASCYDTGQEEQLFDFLIGMEVDEKEVRC